MAEGAPAERKEPKTKKRKSDVPLEDHFDVGRYIEGEVTLEWKELKLDVMLQHGQVRSLNASHRDDLVKEFRVNPPLTLQLTTVHNQGVPPTTSSPLSDCLALERGVKGGCTSFVLSGKGDGITSTQVGKS